MQQIIPMNDYGLFSDKHDTPRADSWYVAKAFEKQPASANGKRGDGKDEIS